MACSAQHVANKVLSSYQWRLATKKYDPTKNVSDEDLDVILEAARLAPRNYEENQPYLGPLGCRIRCTLHVQCQYSFTKRY